METVISLTEILQTNGGFGLAGVLMGVIWRLWVRLNEKDERIFSLLDKQNEIMTLLDRIERRD